jgi:hypothetical protein
MALRRQESVNQLSQRGKRKWNRGQRIRREMLQIALCFGSDNRYGIVVEKKKKINANGRCHTADYKSH